MRFIVDLYRYIIVAFCAVALIAGTVTLFVALDQNGGLGAAYPGWVLAVALAVAVSFILSIGGLALVVSLHDRHADLSDTAAEMKLTLDRIADILAYGTDKEREQ